MFDRFVPRSARSRRSLFVAGVTLLSLATLGLIAFSVRVRDLRAHRATGPGWKFPSRVFSDDVVLTPGRVLPRSYLLAELAARGYQPAGSTGDRPGSFIELPDGARIVLRGFQNAPDPRSRGGPEIVRVHLNDSLVTAVERLGGLPGAPKPDLTHPPRLEPVEIAILFDEERMRRTEVPLARVPRVMQGAVIAA